VPHSQAPNFFSLDSCGPCFHRATQGGKVTTFSSSSNEAAFPAARGEVRSLQFFSASFFFSFALFSHNFCRPNTVSSSQLHFSPQLDNTMVKSSTSSFYTASVVIITLCAAFCAAAVQYCHEDTRIPVRFCMATETAFNASTSKTDLRLTFGYQRSKYGGWNAVGIGSEMVGAIAFVGYMEHTSGDYGLGRMLSRHSVSSCQDLALTNNRSDREHKTGSVSVPYLYP
jgi:hypothetical protein